MYTVGPSKDFQKLLKKQRRSGKFNESLLENLLQLLIGGKTLPSHYEDHALKGDMQEYRQCHLRGDLLVQYKRDEVKKRITLAKIGTHHELLGN